MGYTKVDNQFIDEVMAKLSPSAIAVYLTVLRHTSGWNRESDIISLSQFSRVTGMSINTVSKAITELLDKRCIHRCVQVVNGVDVYAYGIANIDIPLSNIDIPIANIDIPTLSNIDIPIAEIDKGGIAEIDKGVYQKLITQKKDIKKEEKKEESNSDASITVDKKPTGRDDRLDSWQIKAYRELARLTPPHAVRDRMLQLVVNEARWREAIASWIARGYRPQNIDGILDYYTTRYTEKGASRDTGRTITSTHRELVNGQWQDVSIEDYIRRHESIDD